MMYHHYGVKSNHSLISASKLSKVRLMWRQRFIPSNTHQAKHLVSLVGALYIHPAYFANSGE